LLKDKNAAKHNSFEIYYSNDSFIEGFRSFEILYKSGLSSKEIKANLSRLGITKINIVIKGLNDKPSVWHKKLGTSDGGEFYLFVLKSASSSEALIVRKIIS